MKMKMILALVMVALVSAEMSAETVKTKKGCGRCRRYTQHKRYNPGAVRQMNVTAYLDVTDAQVTDVTDMDGTETVDMQLNLEEPTQFSADMNPAGTTMQDVTLTEEMATMPGDVEFEMEEEDTQFTPEELEELKNLE